jgi:hypothetical protein
MIVVSTYQVPTASKRQNIPIKTDRNQGQLGELVMQ